MASAEVASVSDAVAAGAAAPMMAALPAPKAAPADRPSIQSRKIIRNADMLIEVDTPERMQTQVTQLAEDKGGFMVSSDVRRDDSPSRRVEVRLVMRVPSSRFSETLEALRALGQRVGREHVSGQDVTEEFLDVEARLRALRSVEEQFLAIMKDAKTVKDALEVQKQLGEVRSEIERFEGRRRFLEDQSSMSTISLTISERPAVADASQLRFGESVREAARDAVAIGAGIITGSIRLLGALIPVVLLLGLPLYVGVRALRRRSARSRAMASSSASLGSHTRQAASGHAHDASSASMQ